MTGYAGEFVRVTLKDGTYKQGGSNHGLLQTEEDGYLIIRAANGGYLINGVHHRQYIVVPLDEIKSIQIDNIAESSLPIPKSDTTFVGSPNGGTQRREVNLNPSREPIKTAAAVAVAA